jgi:hypothetical protein
MVIVLLDLLFCEIAGVIIKVIFDIGPVAVPVPSYIFMYFSSPLSNLRSLNMLHLLSVPVTLRSGLTKYFHLDSSPFILRKQLKQRSLLSWRVLIKRTEAEWLRVL